MHRTAGHAPGIPRSVARFEWRQTRGSARQPGNVPNHGLIDNLPIGCTVEVPVLVDKSGLQLTRIGALPLQLAAIMQTNVNVQALAV